LQFKKEAKSKTYK